MIKTKLKNIVNAREAVQRLTQQMLPVKVSYSVTKLVNRMNEELKVYDTERIKLCEKYGEIDETKTSYKILKGDEFNSELNSLLDFEVELDVMKIELPEALSITPTDLMFLEDFVSIGDDVNA